MNAVTKCISNEMSTIKLYLIISLTVKGVSKYAIRLQQDTFGSNVTNNSQRKGWHPFEGWRTLAKQSHGTTPKWWLIQNLKNAFCRKWKPWMNSSNCPFKSDEQRLIINANIFFLVQMIFRTVFMGKLLMWRLCCDINEFDTKDFKQLIELKARIGEESQIT